MKHLSSPGLSLVLLSSALFLVYGIHVDLALQYRQNVPIGTGPTSSAAQPSPTSTPLSSATASEISPTSKPDSSASLALSSTPSTSIIETSDSVSPSVTDSSLESSSSSPGIVSSGSDAGSPATVTTASSTNVAASTGKALTGSTTATIAPVSSSSQRILITVTSVVGGSTTQISAVSTSVLLPVSTPGSTSTSPSTSGSDDNSSNSPGLETSQKRVIVGVVVGVGGAILLGGLAVVAWRIWGRRKHSAEEGHELMDSQPGSSSLEKRSSVSDNSPFRSTLDQYHNPAGPVNTASNF
ncbi:hypothetical protein MMC29_007416 [Sticta canariensis]|nr:hypothetical protein [Sticta canariensis]